MVRRPATGHSWTYTVSDSSVDIWISCGGSHELSLQEMKVAECGQHKKERSCLERCGSSSQPSLCPCLLLLLLSHHVYKSYEPLQAQPKPHLSVELSLVPSVLVAPLLIPLPWTLTVYEVPLSYPCIAIFLFVDICLVSPTQVVIISKRRVLSAPL